MIELLVVDDHTIFRKGIARLMADEPDIRVTVDGNTVDPDKFHDKGGPCNHGSKQI